MRTRESSGRAAERDTAAMTDAAALIKRQRDGFSLEAEFYRAPAVFAAELARIFRRQWLFVGHSCEIPNPGDIGFARAIGAVRAG